MTMTKHAHAVKTHCITYIYLHCIVAQSVGENDTQGNWPQDTVPGNQIWNKLQRQSLHGSLIIVGPKIVTFRTHSERNEHSNSNE